MSLSVLDKAVASAFPPCPINDFVALTTQALAGEYFGEACFAALVKGAEREEDRALWDRKRRLERATIARLEPLMARHALPLPPRAPMAALGARAAAAFPGARYRDYCGWIAPMVPAAIENFRNLLALCEDADDRAVCVQLLDHELVIEHCLSQLDKGVEFAVATLDAHLATAEPSLRVAMSSLDQVSN